MVGKSQGTWSRLGNIRDSVFAGCPLSCGKQDGMLSFSCHSRFFTISEMFDFQFFSYDGHHDKQNEKSQ